MDKEHILSEIRRTAEANDGKPLGRNRFAVDTGIKTGDWYGVYWANWGDALVEAGYERNQFQEAFDEEILIVKLATLTKELRHRPRDADLKMKSLKDSDFPDRNTFRRLGNMVERAKKLIDWCKSKEGFDDVISLWQEVLQDTMDLDFENLPTEKTDEIFGYVYLFKSGKHYKIGRSNSSGRREYELAIQLPDKLTKVHEISTDDPVGIEKYWHNRFAEKRKNGEWFELTTADIKAFKRRKFM